MQWAPDERLFGQKRCEECGQKRSYKQFRSVGRLRKHPSVAVTRETCYDCEMDLADVERILRAETQSPPRHRLTDEDCWRMRCWNSGPTEQQHYSMELVSEGRRATRCEACGGTNLSWNGQTYYCNACDQPCYPPDELIRSITVDRTEAAVRFHVAKPDSFYEKETQAFRNPAVLNWPHGRIRTRINSLNEEKPRQTPRYRMVRRHKLRWKV